MTTPNDDLASKIGVEGSTSQQAYDSKHGTYQDNLPVDIEKVPPLPDPHPAPFGPMK